MLLSRSCCACSGVAEVCCSRAAAACSEVGCAVMPPVPPLKLTFVADVLLMTVLLFDSGRRYPILAQAVMAPLMCWVLQKASSSYSNRSADRRSRDFMHSTGRSAF